MTPRYKGWTRSIPAWAGETDMRLLFTIQMGVYPRVGGGNQSANSIPPIGRGLSPRGRGKRHRFLPFGRRRWSIPAWAGETSHWPAQSSPSPVYPRVGGGNPPAALAVLRHNGLSPRGRGKLPIFHHAGIAGRSIPAWAGETPTVWTWPSWKPVYPRVGGGNFPSWKPCPAQNGLSPRGRGKRRAVGLDYQNPGSIPAWAGETTPPRTAGRWRRVYPRVGGGNA